jgi:hypothetical protein
MKTVNKQFLAVLLLTAGLAGGAAALQVQNKQKSDDGGLAARVDKRIQDWQPTKAERRLDDVGWAKDLRDALRLAKENGRPVFLFTYSGSAIRENAISLRRC